MGKRIESEQNTHHRKVRELARKYKHAGYSVKVDGVRGYERPATIGMRKYRPDIEATKSGKRIIVEVKTTKSLVKDKEQLKTFARSATYGNRTEFHLVVANPRKRQLDSRSPIRDQKSRIDKSGSRKVVDRISRSKGKSR